MASWLAEQWNSIKFSFKFALDVGLRDDKPFGAGYPTTNPEDRRKINEALKKLEEDPTSEQIVELEYGRQMRLTTGETITIKKDGKTALNSDHNRPGYDQ
jgi:hypothetical protein